MQISETRELKKAFVEVHVSLIILPILKIKQVSNYNHCVE